MTTTDQSMQLSTAIDEAKQGADLMIRCPAHDDGRASLHVTPSTTGVLLKCHADCPTERILEAVNLTWSDLFHEPDTNVTGEVWTPGGNASHVYPYTDELGNVLYEVLRVPQGRGKTFFQRRPTGDPVRPYVWKLDGVERVLYRLPQVTAAVANGETVYVVEGEKDADNLVGRGYHATTNAQGAGKWQPQFSEALAGAKVVVIADADNVGREHARRVRESLVEHGCSVAIMEAPAPRKDVSDLLLAGGAITDLLMTVPFDEIERLKYGIDVLDVIVRSVADIQWVIPGTLSRKERLLVTGLEGHGKEVALSTTIPTIAGWTTMGEIHVGDQVFSSNGHPVRVLAKSKPEYPTAGSWRVVFSDGSEVIAGGDHQWITYTLRAREVEAVQRKRARTALRGTDQRHKIVHRPSVVTTDGIARSLTVTRSSGEVTNHSIKVAGALELPEADLPIPPYILGAWLGDGATADGIVSVAVRDKEILTGMEADGFTDWYVNQSRDRDTCQGWRSSTLRRSLRNEGMLGYKHIPDVYLRASKEQRLALLAGICDTDGYQDPRGATTGRGRGESRVEITFTNERLAHDTMALLRTVGVIPHLITGEAKIGDKSYGAKYRISFSSQFNPFRYCTFKRDRWNPLRTMRSQHRYIKAIERVPDQLMQCIQVEGDGTYLVEDDLIPTHNSTLLRQMAVQAAAGIHWWSLADIEPQRVLLIDAENEPGQALESWQDLIGKAAFYDRPVERGQLTVLEEWDSDIDLASPRGTEWLHERIHGYQPDVCLLGPLTNLVGRDLKDDEPVRRLKAAVNSARSICGTAFVMEHHAPHKNPSDKVRSIRPYGSSMFLKWPDYGYGMKPHLDVEGMYLWERTRWPRVRSRSWPQALAWGRPNTADWPWCEAMPPEEVK